MITLDQLSNAISEVRADRLPLDEFESWFRNESRNVHDGPEDVLAVVFAVESVLSERRFAEMPDQSAKLELENAIRPFVLLPSEPWNVEPLSLSVIDWSEALAPQQLQVESFGKNNSGVPVGAQSGSNATYFPNRAEAA